MPTIHGCLKYGTAFFLFELQKNYLTRYFCGLHLRQICIAFSISTLVEFSITRCQDCHSCKCWFTSNPFDNRLLLLLLPK